jgi:hypothetical protein
MKRALWSSLAVLCFGAGVAAVWSVFALSGRPRVGSAYDEKLEHLARAGDQYDTLYIGSSRVFRGLDPAVIERAAEEHGLKMHGFNCGEDGMFAPEDSYVFEQALKGRREPLKWVLIETSSFLPTAAELANPSDRLIAWHDWPRTMAACRSAYGAREERKASFFKRWSRRLEVVSKNWKEISGHLRCFALRTTRLGRGGALVQSLVAPQRVAEPPLPIVEARGFIPLTQPRTPRDLAKWEEAVKERRAQPGKRRILAPEAQRNLEGMLSLARKSGARVIMLHPPMLSPMIYEPGPQTHVPLLDYSDPDKYPVLYALENRKEHAHLNAKGAEVFSRIVGEEWARVAAGQ